MNDIHFIDRCDREHQRFLGQCLQQSRFELECHDRYHELPIDIQQHFLDHLKLIDRRNKATRYLIDNLKAQRIDIENCRYFYTSNLQTIDTSTDDSLRDENTVPHDVRLRQYGVFSENKWRTRPAKTNDDDFFSYYYRIDIM